MAAPQALTKDASVVSKGAKDILRFRVTPSNLVFRNAIVTIPETTDCVVPAPTGGYGAGPAQHRAGIARTRGDAVTTPVNVYVEVYTQGIFLLESFVDLVQSDVGKQFYATSDKMITNVPATNTLLGTITKIVNTSWAWVKLLPFGVQS